MRFVPFRRRRAEQAGAGTQDQLRENEVRPREWVDSGVAQEVSAYLTGRYVEFLLSAGRNVPAGAEALDRYHAGT